MVKLPTTGQYDQARDAVKHGVASEQQKQMVAREAKQAGSRGNAARDAFQKGANKR